MTSGLPFDDIRNLISRLPAMDKQAATQVSADLAAGGEDLGRLGEIAQWFAAVTGRAPARVLRPAVALFAATHSVSAKLGISDPVSEARARVEVIAAGAASVSQLCASTNLGLNVFDLALDLPVEDFSEGPALDERAAAATMAFGMEAIAAGPDLICLGTVDRSSDLSAIALLGAISRDEKTEWAALGKQEKAIIAEALRLHGNHFREPLEAMRRLGGREVAALAGAILAARAQKIAVVIDGLAATAAAAVLHALKPDALQHCLLSSAETEAHRQAAAQIGLKPILDLDGLKSGGVAGALALGVVRGAGDVSVGMAEVTARARG